MMKSRFSFKKGIVLAGGTGSRLFPITRAMCKQLLPVYDKPLIYYPLDTLLSMGVDDILLICNPHEQTAFQALLGDGSQWGIHLRYAVQNAPKGIAEALLIGADFIGDDAVALILGDNIFDIDSIYHGAQSYTGKGAMIFALRVPEPQRFGVLAFDAQGKVVDIVEKPIVAPSDYAISGLYLLDKQAVHYARSLTPSARGELEITDIQRQYLHSGSLKVHRLPEKCVWFDTGTAESLFDATQWVRTKQRETGVLIGAVEETAFSQNKISSTAFLALAKAMEQSDYGRSLCKVALKSIKKSY